MASEIYLDKLYNKEGTTKVVDLTTSELTNINLTSSVGNLPSNRNLIINGDFRVNQRGAASRTENTNAYNYDRWYYDGTYLYQGIEDKSVANGTYTLTWIDAGSDITAAYIVSTDSSNNNGPDSGLTYTSVSNGGNITVSEGTEYSKHLWIRFGGTLANLSKVQLEAGTVATPFERRLIGTELMLCQRYYQRFTGNATFCGNCAPGEAWISTNTSNHIVSLVTEMRSAPTLQQSGLDLRNPSDGNISATVSIVSTATSKSVQLGTSGSSGLTVRRMYWIAANSGYMAFEAEL